MIEKRGDISVREAKLRMLEWSERADEAIQQQVHEVIATARQGAMRAIPWAAGGALLVGLLAGRGKRAGDGRARGPISAGIGMVRTGIKVAMFVLPLVRPFLAQRQREE